MCVTPVSVPPSLGQCTTPHPFIQMFKPVLLLALDDYLFTVTRLFGAIRLIMRNSERKDVFIEKFTSPQNPSSSQTHGGRCSSWSCLQPRKPRNQYTQALPPSTGISDLRLGTKGTHYYHTTIAYKGQFSLSSPKHTFDQKEALGTCET
ncbi:hypothetical protein BGW80DRAFT_1563127 [Lactifluus volemus]|nr:hypothetical protein BGW80DRAFT_1564632 [Lactifluus volemus]KAH9965555.1 hypothetical protein BGW80DRAFT_1563127 [Lactifluus volemus]